MTTSTGYISSRSVDSGANHELSLPDLAKYEKNTSNLLDGSGLGYVDQSMVSAAAGARFAGLRHKSCYSNCDQGSLGSAMCKFDAFQYGDWKSVNDSDEEDVKERRTCPDVEDLVQRLGRMDFEVDQWSSMAKKAMSSDSAERLEGVRAFRYMLSVSGEIPIQAVIETGVVPALVAYLDSSDFSLQFEAAWALTNIASGTPDQTAAVVQNGGIKSFVNLLQSPDEGVREQGMWGLGNIAGDRAEYRDGILNMENALHGFISAIEHSSRRSSVRTGVWALSNLCRGKPRPKLERLAPIIPVVSEVLRQCQSDSDICADACWALDGVGDCAGGIDTILRSSIVEQVIGLLTAPTPAVQRPALRVVGQIATGSVEQTQILLNYSVCNILSNLIESPKKSIRKDACWTLSNIAAGTHTQTQCLIDSGVCEKLCMLALYDPEPDVRKEAAWAIANAIVTGNAQQMFALTQMSCLKPISFALLTGDNKVAHAALEAIHKLLIFGETLKKEAGVGIHGNIAVNLLQEHDVLTHMRQLMATTPEMTIHRKINHLGQCFNLVI